MGQYVGGSGEGGTLMYIEVFDKKTKEYIGLKNLHKSATEEEQWTAAIGIAKLYWPKVFKKVETVEAAREVLIMEVHGV